MRIIIAGAGAVGRHLAKLLSREDMDISLIDDRQDRLGDLDANYDLLTKVGSPMSIHDLKSIGVKDVGLSSCKIRLSPEIPPRLSTQAVTVVPILAPIITLMD